MRFRGKFTYEIEVSPELDPEDIFLPPMLVQRPEEIVAGRDGVILQSEGRQGVVLPQVWEETGWTREEFLQQLAHQKAGLAPDAWQRAQLHVFQDQIFEE